MRLATILLVFTSAACGGTGAPTGPTPPQSAVTVFSVIPQVGFGGTSILITGAGFATGATVSVGGTATRADMIDNSRIQAVVPSGSGTVDVVVTNPDGQTGRSTTGFTYNVVTLTPSATFVAAGTEMNVSWTTAHARNFLDWIGLFELEAPNTSYGWWEYASGTGGVFGLNAPLTRGRYEFRYLLDDGYFDVARSAPITVQ